MNFDDWWVGMDYSPEDPGRGKAKEAWDTKAMVEASLLDQIKSLKEEVSDLRRPKTNWRSSISPTDPRFRNKIQMVRKIRELTLKSLPEVTAALDRAGGVYEEALKFLGYTPGEGEPNEATTDGSHGGPSQEGVLPDSDPEPEPRG